VFSIVSEKVDIERISNTYYLLLIINDTRWG